MVSFFILCNQTLSAYDFTSMDSLMNRWIQRSYYPGASVVIVKNDSLIFEKYFGNYTPETEVYIASAGKWLAAATIAAVVDRTELSWNDPVEKWLPEFKGDPKGKILLRQLMSHTSGIRDYLPLPQIDTFNVLTESVSHILPLDTVFTPGSRFQYGGLALQVAGRMAEVASGKDFETIFQDLIASPLGMKNTHFTPINLEGGHSPMLGGGARTVLKDYLKFLKMIFHDGLYDGKQILKRESILAMQADQIGSAHVYPGEFTERAFGSFHTGIYGLGEWREKVDSLGNAYQISSPGWAGAYPWINKKDGVYGFFLAHVQGSAAKKDGFSPFYDAPVLSGLTTTIVQSANVKQRFADIGDGMLFYEEKGVGEPLILLHAHSVDRRMWDKQFDELSHKYRVIRFDLRGYGLSTMPVEGKDFSYAEDLKKFMDVLNIPKAHLVGLSLGALTISDFMTLYPERVLSAVLASGALSPQVVPHAPVAGLKAYKIAWKKSMREISFADNPFLMSLIDDWRMWQLAHIESSKIFLGDVAIAYYQKQKVRIPVLFLVGECDGKGSKQAAVEMARLLPVHQLKYIKSAGHFSCIEQPEAFNKAVLDFLKRHSN